MTSRTQTPQVLVIGAGPVGLLAALLLHRQGITTRIVDENPAQSAESRASVMSSRSLEIFGSIGLAEQMMARGVITTRLQFHVSGKLAGGLDFDRADSPDAPYRFLLMIPQSETEAVLIEALTKAGVTVERSTRAKALTQDDTGVTVTLERGGTPETIRADYAIGADGAHSIVRHALGLSFEGSKYPQGFLLGDVEVDWPHDHETFRMFMHGDRVGLFLPLGGPGSSRVMTTDIRPATEEPGALTLEELQATFSEVAQVPVTLRNPQWLTHFRTHHRAVDKMRVGRIFVAGDAAHIHSPAGGQGMNTGLQDVANLAWKLAQVLRGGPNALLDSYNDERLPVAQDVLHFTDRIFTLAAGQTGWHAKLRDWLAPVAMGTGTRLDIVQDKAFRKFGQLMIGYHGGAAVLDSDGAGPRPGDRAPDARLSRHRDLFDVTTGYDWTLLALSHKRLHGDGLPHLQDRLEEAAPGVRVRILTRLSVGTHPLTETLERTELFGRYGLEDEDAQALLLVRPDGYIGWRAEAFDTAALQDAVRSLGLALLDQGAERQVERA